MNLEERQKLQLINVSIDEIKILCSTEVNSGNELLNLLRSMENRIPNLIESMRHLNNVLAICDHSRRDNDDNFVCDKFPFDKKSSLSYITHFTQDWVLFVTILQENNYIRIFELERTLLDEISVSNSNKEILNNARSAMISEPRHSERRKELAIVFVEKDNIFKNSEVSKNETERELKNLWEKIRTTKDGAGFLRSKINPRLMILIRENNIQTLNDFISMCRKVIFIRNLEIDCLSPNIPEDVRNGTVAPGIYKNQLDSMLIHQVMVNVLQEFITFIHRYGYRLYGID